MNNYVAINPETNEVMGKISFDSVCKYAVTYFHPIWKEWIAPFFRKDKASAEREYEHLLSILKFDNKSQKWTKEQLKEAKKSLQIYDVILESDTKTAVKPKASKTPEVTVKPKVAKAVPVTTSAVKQTVKQAPIETVKHEPVENKAVTDILKKVPAKSIPKTPASTTFVAPTKTVIPAGKVIPPPPKKKAPVAFKK